MQGYCKDFYFKIILFYCLIYVLMGVRVDGKTMPKRGIMDNIGNGVKHVGQMLGINTALDVANLVTKAFSSNTSTKRQENIITDHSDNLKSPPDALSPVGFFTGLLKLMGFDNSKLGALAINGIILIAQMIGNVLISRPPPPPPPPQQQTATISEEYNVPHQPRMEQDSGRQARNGLPIDWILENPSKDLSKLLLEIRDRKLPEYLAESVDKLEKQRGEGDCVKLLLCKSAPFVWGMQKSVSERLDGSNSSEEEITNEDGDRLHSFFKYLPDVEEYKTHGQFCEERYPNCNLSTI